MNANRIPVRLVTACGCSRETDAEREAVYTGITITIVGRASARDPGPLTPESHKRRRHFAFKRMTDGVAVFVEDPDHA